MSTKTNKIKRKYKPIPQNENWKHFFVIIALLLLCMSDSIISLIFCGGIGFVMYQVADIEHTSNLDNKRNAQTKSARKMLWNKYVLLLCVLVLFSIVVCF